MLSGEVLVEFWEKCPEDLRKQVEKTAKSRLESATDGDVLMVDAKDPTSPISQLSIDDKFKITNSRRKSMPMVTLTETELDPSHKAGGMAEFPVLRPSDPDPFLNVGLDNVRLKSRRGSVGVIPPEEASGGDDNRQNTPVEPRPGSSFRAVTPDIAPASKPRMSLLQRAKTDNRGVLPDNILVQIFQYLELHHLLRLRAVSAHWSEILTKSPRLVQYLDLSVYNRSITDDVVSTIICPFVQDRPRYIDISNCFHITDEGFTALAKTCGPNVKAWKMKSVWDVTASAILEMASTATGLQEVDLSNCRKVSDTLLARLVGWVVPAATFAHHNSLSHATKGGIKPTLQTTAGAVYGCPQLKRLTLSYCKHVTDRSMHHIASHAAPRIEQVDLTRCTTITDQGFQYWGNAQFTRLRKLCLADCTYLTDNAIVYLTNAAKQLQELDLVC